MAEPAVDVAIVGAGPAGLGAALALKRHGVRRVVVVEREAEAGGVPRHCAHSPFGLREFGRVLLGPAYARRLVAAAEAAGVEIRLWTSVVAIEPGPRLALTAPEGVATLTARKILLATGARETPRAARLVGGDRPIGVITTGTLQQAVHLEGQRPFDRPVILGTELVALSAIITCRQAGIRPVAVVEPAPRPSVPLPLSLFPRLMGLPVHLGTAIAEILGRGRVEAVRLSGPGNASRELGCDGVLFTGRFVPESSLARLAGLALDPLGGPRTDADGRTSDRDVFAAGNGVRPVRTGGWCFRDGQRVARAIVRDLREG
jgi:thioredoxin reductase